LAITIVIFVRYLAAIGLAVHGLIHVLGFAATWRVGRITAVSAIPTLPGGLTEGSAPVRLLGLLWLVALAGFVVAAIGIIADFPWWKHEAAASALLSLILCIAWWKDAKAGVAIDVVILLGLAASIFR
jgi:hypothetical protein